MCAMHAMRFHEKSRYVPVCLQVSAEPFWLREEDSWTAIWRLGAVHTRWNGRGGELCAVVRRSGGSRAQLEAAAFPIYCTTRAAMYPRVYT